ncbi:thioesterase [Ktedonosporobacter rubrisoli]|uniref:Thioesterase n=1 Tax=Ktedonosporobacter rubrisoli TaxID=2509675 RepID=A0A4P6JR72_KTERU|nr:alpha/beta fold hydrolase [Ktedonosporobacter rubrisoli]QBD77286.1 thioesterase [Ktedonosporobacter rubrisoli]
MVSERHPDFHTWVIRARPNPHARLRLFCFPYSGKGASLFHTWSQELPPDIEVCAIELPGRESRFREPPFTQLVPLVQELAEVLHPYLDVPFAFFGHCVGSLISFTLARQLRRSYQVTPAFLFLAAHRAPQLPSRQIPLHALPDSEFLEGVHCLNGITEETFQNSMLMQLVLPSLRADFTLGETYQYEEDEPFACPLVVFGGRKDHLVSNEELVAWHIQTRSDFTFHLLEGGHFFLHESRQELLSEISKKILYWSDGTLRPNQSLSPNTSWR